MAQGFLVAMKKFFGLREGQTPTEFGKEVMRLSYEEKVEFHSMLTAQGIDCDPPTKPAPAK